MKQSLVSILMALTLLVGGCHLYSDRQPTADLRSPAINCRQRLERVDRLVAAAGTTDTSVFPVAGFPYLRASRFLADTARRPNGPRATRRWLERMHALDISARKKEIVNLNDAQLEQLAQLLGTEAHRESLTAAVENCSRRLFDQADDKPSLASDVRDALSFPGEYRLWRRAVGLYPLVALPVAYVSAARFDEFRQWHARPPDQHPRAGRPVVYRPGQRAPARRIMPQDLYRQTPIDPLGLPLLTPDDKRRLAAALAPTIVQDTAGAYDHIGALHWQGNRPAIAGERPAVYYYFSHARFDDQPSLQINYVFWYSHRSGPLAPWIERGQLDGLTMRISLDPSGRPVMLDIMNNCGCYHFFVPAHDRIDRIENPLLGLDPLVPAWLPQAFPGKRLRVTVTSGWHQVLNIATDNSSDPGKAYALRPYEELEMLSDEHGRRRSIFDRNGIVYGSGRIEPFIFFSMGIPHIGSMRQRGRHAIQLVGRAHFDDPLLFDRTFDYR